MSLGLLTSFISCSGNNEPETGDTISLVSIKFQESSVKLKVNDTYQLELTYLPKNATNKNVRYSTQQENILSVDSSGLVTALKEGVGVVTATSIDGNKKANCRFEITSGTTPVDPTPIDPTPIDPTPIDPTPVDPDPEEDEFFTLDTHNESIQDYNVLHCFNWSLENIKSSLSDIKEAGYKAIQTSPMQPHINVNNYDWKNNWYWLYQPTGFKVAGPYENALGDKNQLISLCSEANKLGIKVIVDVVANHLANTEGDNRIGSVCQYNEPEIYQNQLVHSLGTHTNDPDYDNRSDWIIRGAIGLPDLMTEDERVQKRVLSLLKEYIDCGVSGFRFDAAKHIETPDDGEYASNFWPYVLNGVTNYAVSLGKEKPYFYGEILGTPGNLRDFSWYTKYMSVTDSKTSSDVLSAIKDESIYKVNSATYKSGVAANKIMLWGESHDTYSNPGGESENIPAEKVNLAYVIQASRKDAASLYLVRPSGNMGSIGSLDYKSNIISKANIFHSLTMFAKEDIYDDDTYCFINERGNKGIAIVDVANYSQYIDITFKHNKSGTFVDLISGEKYTLDHGKIHLHMTNRVALLIKEQ